MKIIAFISIFSIFLAASLFSPKKYELNRVAGNSLRSTPSEIIRISPVWSKPDTGWPRVFVENQECDQEIIRDLYMFSGFSFSVLFYEIGLVLLGITLCAMFPRREEKQSKGSKPPPKPDPERIWDQS